MLAQLLHRIGISNQKIETVANEIGGGLVSCVENEDAIVQQFEIGQPLDQCFDRRELAGRDQLGQDFAFIPAVLPRSSLNQTAQINLEVVDGLRAAAELFRSQDGLQCPQD